MVAENMLNEQTQKTNLEESAEVEHVSKPNPFTIFYCIAYSSLNLSYIHTRIEHFNGEIPPFIFSKTYSK